MRKLIIAGGSILLVLAVIFLGAGWYYSGEIISGLTIAGPSEEYPYEVTAVSGDTVTYQVPTDVGDPATDHNTTNRVGMAFEDGAYIQLAQDAQVSGSSVTRGFEVLAGEAPAAGEMGQMDWPSFPGPEAFDYPVEDVTYDTPLGPSPALLLTPEGAADTWAIMVHGRSAPVREGFRVVPLLLDEGYPTLVINYRDDLKDPGAQYEDGIGNVGYTEWADLDGAVQYALDRGAEKVLLAGYSMGGGIIASYLQQGTNTDAVVGTILLTPLINMHQVVQFGAERFGIPGPVQGPLVWLAELIAEARINLDFDAVDYIDNAATWPVPAFVTAASEDNLVPPVAIEEFAAALPDGEFLYFEGAQHTGGWNYDSQRFEESLRQWLTTALP